MGDPCRDGGVAPQRWPNRSFWRATCPARGVGVCCGRSAAAEPAPPWHRNPTSSLCPRGEPAAALTSLTGEVGTARVDPVTHAQAGWSVRLTYWFTRRAITRLTGRRPQRMIEPVQVYARIPALLRGSAKVEQATAGLAALPDRVRALAELRAATLTSCGYCFDLGSQVARRWGLTNAQLLALPAYRSSNLFTCLL